MKKNVLILISVCLISNTCLFAQKKLAGGKETGSMLPLKTQSSAVACDTIFSFPVIASWSAGLAFDGTSFYSADNSSAVIAKYDLNGTLTGTLPSPAIDPTKGGDLDFDGTYLWLVVEQDGIIYKLDPSTGAVILQYNLPTSNVTDPDDFGCAWDNGFIWITEYVDQTLMRIDPATGAVVDSFEINRQVLPLKNINNNLYGIELNGPTGSQLLHFDKSNGNVIDSIPWCLNYPLGLCPAANHLWGLSSQSTNRVYEFDSLLISGENNILNEYGFSFYPVPAKDNLNLIFEIRKSSEIKIDLYNAIGQQMKTLFQRKQTEGRQHLTFDIKEFPAGIYFLKVNAGESCIMKKLIILK